MKKRTVPTVVLGAGAMGSATAYHLARRGEPVVLVEQFAFGHDRGSSHGAARIIRHSYADPRYARLMLDAYRAWRELEADAGLSLYLRTGGVSISPQGVDYVSRVESALSEIGIHHRRMSGSDWNRCQPVFGLAATDDVVFEPDAGLLTASKAIAVQLELARRLGGNRSELVEHARVSRIDLEESHPTLIFEDQVLVAERLIVTAGPWTASLLPSLAGTLTTTRQQVLYFRSDDRDQFSIGRFPAFMYQGSGEADAYYGMPECLGMSVKVARHGGLDVDPDVEDRTIESSYLHEVRGLLRRLIPPLADSPIDRREVCLYTMTADDGFRVGPIPGRADVVVASPCSGHGFKFSCLIGRVLADLAIEGSTAIDIDPWRIS